MPADELAMAATRHYWNTAVAFMSAAATRKAVLPSLEKLIRYLSKVRNPSAVL